MKAIPLLECIAGKANLDHGKHVIGKQQRSPKTMSPAFQGAMPVPSLARVLSRDLVYKFPENPCRRCELERCTAQGFFLGRRD